MFGQQRRLSFARCVYWFSQDVRIGNCARHRESREAKVLKAIESGAETGFEIVSRVYSDTDPSLWPAALSNVKLHVEHLAYLRKIPVVRASRM